METTEKSQSLLPNDYLSLKGRNGHPSFSYESPNFYKYPNTVFYITYFDLEGLPLSYKKKGKKWETNYIRKRMSPEFVKRSPKKFKYLSPKGVKPRIFMNGLYHFFYGNYDQIKVLTIVEGEKKAIELCKKRIPSIAMPGIHFTRDKDTGLFLEDLIYTFYQLKNLRSVNLLFDADLRDSDTTKRKISFYTAVRNYSKAINKYPNLLFYFTHPNENFLYEKNLKGIDDIIIALEKDGKHDQLNLIESVLLDDENTKGNNHISKYCIHNHTFHFFQYFFFEKTIELPSNDEIQDFIDDLPHFKKFNMIGQRPNFIGKGRYLQCDEPYFTQKCFYSDDHIPFDVSNIIQVSMKKRLGLFKRKKLKEKLLSELMIERFDESYIIDQVSALREQNLYEDEILKICYYMQFIEFKNKQLIPRIKCYRPHSIEELKAIIDSNKSRYWTKKEKYYSLNPKEEYMPYEIGNIAVQSKSIATNKKTAEKIQNLIKGRVLYIEELRQLLIKEGVEISINTLQKIWKSITGHLYPKKSVITALKISLILGEDITLKQKEVSKILKVNISTVKAYWKKKGEEVFKDYLYFISLVFDGLSPTPSIGSTEEKKGDLDKLQSISECLTEVVTLVKKERLNPTPKTEFVEDKLNEYKRETEKGITFSISQIMVAFNTQYETAKIIHDSINDIPAAMINNQPNNSITSSPPLL